MSADGKDPTEADKIKAKHFASRVFGLCLLVMLPFAAYFILHGLGNSNISWPVHFSWLLGVVFAILLTLLFIGIIFYLSRAGYDDQPNYRDLVEKDREAKKKRRE